MAQDADYFKAQGRQLTDVVSDLRHATDKVSTMTENIEQEAPGARNIAHQSLNNIEVALAEARQGGRSENRSLFKPPNTCVNVRTVLLFKRSLT